jgi:hypothetical protein
MNAVGQGPGDRMDSAAFAEKHIERLQQAAKTLRGLADEPLPETLTDAEKTEAMKYTRWLRESSQKLNELARRWQDTRSNIGMIQSSVTSHEKMKEMNISFNGKYSAMRDELLNELRQFATISPTMKGNYAIAQGSINKLR